MIPFKKPSPLVQMTLALMTMTISIVLLADLVLGITGQSDRQRHAARQQLAESLGVQTATLLQSGDTSTLERTLREMLLRVDDMRSVGLRREDGALLLAVGPHEAGWRRAGDGRSTADQVRVPLSANGRPWGGLEVAYRSADLPWWSELAQSPLARMLAFVAVVGSVGYALYMRRALQHLDPASVIPERVQRAFDAMAEGVVVLDARGRVMLANRAFRAMGGSAAAAPRVGQALSSIDWLAGALPADIAAHPWMRAMVERANTFNDALTVAGAEGAPRGPDDGTRKLVVSCAPILDNAGSARGCMVTFNDMTELHRVNTALQRAMDELKAGREALHRNNQKLRRMAMHDPMTSCLNRRAFMHGAPARLQAARAQGTEVGCLMLDIDHFKSINDNHGHGIGDRVITEVAKVLLQSARNGDLVCRYGGEEFCILAPASSRESLLALGERVRTLVQDEVGPRVAEVPGLRVTISVGASMLGGKDDQLAALINRSDEALYAAKRGGRNRVAEFTAAGVPADEVTA